MSKTFRDPNTTQRTILSVGPDRSERKSASLVVIHGEALGARTNVGDTPAIIGRSPECELQIPHRSVSRMHCQVWRENDVYRIRDLGSTNRTFLNDRPVVEGELNDGDHITIGESILKFISRTSVEARYHEELYQLANYDALTELYNRRQFQEYVEKEIARSHRHQRGLAMIFLDVDHFKSINDRLGHQGGDVILRELGALLRRQLVEDAIGARIGGEEFAIVLPEADLAAAVALAERIRLAVMACAPVVQGKVEKFTVSLGIAMLGADTPGRSELMRAADAQLYRAKQTGRNKVCAPGSG